MNAATRILALSAVTLATRDMARATRFYDALGFTLRYGGAQADFSSYALGPAYLNLIAQDAPLCWWGRVIIHVSDVDAMHRLALDCGFAPHAAPADAPWGERYFHINDPDGHELSFAAPLAMLRP
jgi:catechol 2,3-dioxygenase-like lactoylglutathione lyase family enzyme